MGCCYEGDKCWLSHTYTHTRVAWVGDLLYCVRSTLSKVNGALAPSPDLNHSMPSQIENSPSTLQITLILFNSTAFESLNRTAFESLDLTHSNGSILVGSNRVESD